MLPPKGFRVIKIRQSPTLTTLLKTVFCICGMATLGIIAYLFIILS